MPRLLGSLSAAPIQCPVNGATTAVRLTVDGVELCWCHLSGLVCAWPAKHKPVCPLMFCTDRPDAAAWACPAPFFP